MPRYDVFVAYAGPNAPYAMELYEALVTSLGEDRVFIDKQLPPGAIWSEELPRALVDSRVTAAVLARKPSGGWYDKSEFAIAIDEMRNGDHVVGRRVEDLLIAATGSRFKREAAARRSPKRPAPLC